MPKSVERKLYEAFKSSKGVRLTAEDVDSLIHDDAIGTRITNCCASEHGLPEPLGDYVRNSFAVTWRGFAKHLEEAT